MKKFTEILEQIKEVTEEQKHAKQESENALDKYQSFFDEMTFKECCEKRNDPEAIEAHDEYLKVVSKWEETKINCKIKIALLKNNAKIALMNDVIDIVVEVFCKYVKKPYGEKTKEKISNEIKERTNCCAYIRNNVIAINPIHMIGLEYCIEIRMKDYNKKILIDNKIQEFHKDDLELAWCKSSYIEDLDTEVKTIREMQAKILEKEKELKEMCSKYNEHVVNGINCITNRTDANRSF